MKKDSTNRIRSKIWLAIWIYIIITGNVLFYFFIEKTIGIKEEIGQFLMLVFFLAWLAFLFVIENKYFKGLYDEWRNEQSPQ